MMKLNCLISLLNKIGNDLETLIFALRCNEPENNNICAVTFICLSNDVFALNFYYKGSRIYYGIVHDYGIGL